MSDFQFAPAAYQDPAPEGVASLDHGPSLPGATLCGVERVARTVLPRSVMDSTTKGLALRSISAARSCVVRFVTLLMSATAVAGALAGQLRDAPGSAKLVAVAPTDAWYDVASNSGAFLLRVGALWENRGPDWLQAEFLLTAIRSADRRVMACRTSTIIAPSERVRVWCEAGTVPSREPPILRSISRLVGSARVVAIDTVRAEVSNAHLDTLLNGQWETVVAASATVRSNDSTTAVAGALFRLYDSASVRIGLCESLGLAGQRAFREGRVFNEGSCATVPVRIGRVASLRVTLKRFGLERRT